MSRITRQEFLISSLELQPHPEGGYFRETYRSDARISAADLPWTSSSGRNAATSIYYLLEGRDFSAFHRIAQDEIWHFYEGSVVEIHMIDPGGKYRIQCLGRDIGNGEIHQFTVPANCWFAARLKDHSSYSLVGCTVSPGFDFEDFQMAVRVDLVRDFPEFEAIIKALTRA